MIKHYRKQPEEVVAIKYEGTPQSKDNIVAWTSDADTHAYVDGSGLLRLKTLNGISTIHPGDYVVRDKQGNHDVQVGEFFEAEYEEIAN
jgi:hypothetical protein